VSGHAGVVLLRGFAVGPALISGLRGPSRLPGVEPWREVQGDLVEEDEHIVARRYGCILVRSALGTTVDIDDALPAEATAKQRCEQWQRRQTALRNLEAIGWDGDFDRKKSGRFAHDLAVVPIHDPGKLG
jgi:hypothetical protein